MSAMHVTVELKRYVFVCAGCGCLGCSERSDALTCSVACRVQAHRSGDIRRLREIAKHVKVHPAMIQRAAAVEALAPEWGREVRDGKRGLDDMELRRAVWDAFTRLLRSQVGVAA